MNTLPVYTFRNLTNREYGSLRSRYINNPGKTVEDFWSYAYGAVRRALDNNDPSHVNDLLIVAGNEEKIRDTRKVLHSVGVAKAFNGNLRDGFAVGSKMTAAQKRASKLLRQSWESDFSIALMDLGGSKAKEWSEESYITQVLKNASKHGADVIDFAERLRVAAERMTKEAA